MALCIHSDNNNEFQCVVNKLWLVIFNDLEYRVRGICMTAPHCFQQYLIAAVLLLQINQILRYNHLDMIQFSKNGLYLLLYITCLDTATIRTVSSSIIDTIQPSRNIFSGLLFWLLNLLDFHTSIILNPL